MSESRRRRLVVSDSSGSATVMDNSEAIAASLADPDGGSANGASDHSDARVLNGRFRLLREVGRGGMGVVYEAEDLRLAGRRLAVKVLPPEISGDEAAILRLKREAETVCLLDHPNIVRLVEFDADGDCSYIVMEFLNGGNLALHLARSERLPLDQVLDIARQVCPALDFAHAKGVLHRDIKPANLMIREDGPLRQVKVTDFGIAYQVKNSMTRLTGQESAGTLLYLSPEQLQSKKPTARSDQYALAVTLYELLSGEPPFAGAGLAHQVLNNPPSPVEGVPDHVNGALTRALSKDPAERFETCGDFLAALQTPSAAAPRNADAPAVQTVAPQAAAAPAAPERGLAVAAPTTPPRRAPEPQVTLLGGLWILVKTIVYMITVFGLIGLILGLVIWADERIQAVRHRPSPTAAVQPRTGQR